MYEDHISSDLWTTLDLQKMCLLEGAEVNNSYDHSNATLRDGLISLMAMRDNQARPFLTLMTNKS